MGQEEILRHIILEAVLSDSSLELIPDGAYGPSPDDDHPPYPMEVHTEPPHSICKP